MNRAIIRAFYTLKPFIPRSVQIHARRRLARYKRKNNSHIWPIDPNAGQPPKGWQGWPDGKQFALVLLHDVDTRKGYNNVLKLAELEENLGFRSTFSFVPERYGKVSLALLDELRGRGFEIAVHGLKHDGKLFSSRPAFDRQASRINTYLKHWKTEGFTSPSMHRNLDWLASLNIKYSISTFDTDPFEPQPDGAATIFPFWVHNSLPNHGFVEMPYTLPQDSTLFIILQEKTIKIWKEKLAWVAEKGGMVLLNTHLDYMDFSGCHRDGNLLYPVQHYIDFLEYVQRMFAGKYHHALLAEVAAFFTNLYLTSNYSLALTSAYDRVTGLTGLPTYSRFQRQASRRPLRVAMLTYSFYEGDNRVRRYAETLVRRGDSVDVISLRGKDQRIYNELNGVRVFRVQERVRDERGKWDYLCRIMKFFCRSAVLVSRKHFDKPYDLVHVHSVPDFEVFAALVPRILGAKIILDIHDIVPELYASKFQVKKDSLIFKALVFLEKAAISFSDHAIISNDIWLKRLVSRSVACGKCTSILNYPDDHLFYMRDCLKRDDRITLLYPGTLNRHQGLHIAVEAFAKIKDAAPQAEFHIYGNGPAKAGLARQIRRLGLQGRVFLKDSVPLNEIVGIMAKADIGIIPKKNDEFGGDAFSTKTLEFMSLGVPIIVARTRIDQFYFDDSMVKFFEPGSVDDLAVAMLALIRDKSARERLAKNGKAFARQNRWEGKQHLYLDLVDRLCQIHG